MTIMVVGNLWLGECPWGCDFLAGPHGRGRGWSVKIVLKIFSNIFLREGLVCLNSLKIFLEICLREREELVC